MSLLLNEVEADAKVAAVLSRQKGADVVMHLYKDESGRVLQVTGTREVSREDLENNLDRAKELLAAAEANLRAFDELTKPSEPEPQQPAPAAPVEPAPTPPAEPQPAAAPVVIG